MPGLMKNTEYGGSVVYKNTFIICVSIAENDPTSN